MDLAVSSESSDQGVVEGVRPVRLILMEVIQGISMKSMFARNGQSPNDPPDGFHYSEAFRLRIMTGILDSLAR